jgi:hypothetical protein
MNFCFTGSIQNSKNYRNFEFTGSPSNFKSSKASKGFKKLQKIPTNHTKQGEAWHRVMTGH